MADVARKFPKQLNAGQIAQVLGPKPLASTVSETKPRLRQFLVGRGGFSYDPVRREEFGLVSGHSNPREVAAKLLTSGQPLGRKPCAELAGHIGATFAGQAGKWFPVKPQVRVVHDGLIVRVRPAGRVFRDGKTSFAFLLLSKSCELKSAAQIAFMLGVGREVLAQDDFDGAEVEAWDLSCLPKQKARSARCLSSADCVLPSKSEIDSALTLYARAYAELLAEGLPEARKGHGRSFEDEQFDFWP